MAGLHFMRTEGRKLLLWNYVEVLRQHTIDASLSLTHARVVTGLFQWNYRFYPQWNPLFQLYCLQNEEGTAHLLSCSFTGHHPDLGKKYLYERGWVGCVGDQGSREVN